jgi:AraC-like DNA-binding protein
MTIEHFVLPSEEPFPTESHNFYEFAYIKKGSILYTVDDTEYRLKENEILIIEPNKRHSILQCSKGQASFYIICFECASPHMKLLNQLNYKLNTAEKNIINSILTEINSTYVLPVNDQKILQDTSPLGGEQALGLYLELFFILLIRNNMKSIPANSIATKNISDDLLSLITDYLEKSIYKKVDIPTLCKNFNYSKSYICNYFKQKTGETIIEYFNKLKIEEAKKMLIETNYTSEQISDLLSFSDPRYFLFLFKKLTNKTPQQYRKSKV